MTDDDSTRSTPSRSGLRAIWIAYLAVATVWAVQVVRHLALDLRFEDALIVLRYARNVVDGHGFVFNVGERVLGVTTPLHTLMSTIWVVLGGDAAPGWQNTAGVVWLAIQGAFAMAWLQRLGRPWVMLPVGLLILGNYNLVYLYIGMETHAFAALALCALWLAADRTSADRTVRPVALGAVLGAAFLLRYDAALLALLIGLDAWWRDRRLPIRMTIAFFAVVTPWLIFAQLTFGSILPQPLAAKEGFISLVDYLRDVHAYYRDTWTWILGAIFPWDRGIGFSARLFPAVVALGVVGAVVRDRRALIAALYPALHVLVYAALGSDPGFRWHVYLLNPFGFLFFALGVEEGIRLAARWAPERWTPESWGIARDRRLAVVAVVLVALPLIRHLGEQMRFRYQPDPLTVQLTTMGAWLRDHYPAETTVLHPAIGILGWESGLRIVDHAGLVTPGLFFYNDLDATPLDDVVREHRPDLVLLSQWSPEDPTPLGYAPVHVFEQPFVYTLWGLEASVPERAETEPTEGG